MTVDRFMMACVLATGAMMVGIFPATALRWFWPGSPFSDDMIGALAGAFVVFYLWEPRL